MSSDFIIFYTAKEFSLFIIWSTTCYPSYLYC